jgi:23S rRNA (cytosine1962-C5)-methyltransferase
VAVLVSGSLPCIIFEDDHLLVVNKPAGLNTHAPSPYAVEGIYEWLRRREPRWSELGIVQRLDKETSGVLILTRTKLASRLMAEQFARRKVRKKYVLLTDRPAGPGEFRVKTKLVRVGDRYVSQPGSLGVEAETFFKVLYHEPGQTRIQAEPVTGRTHQIRVHAAERGFPILGDTLYGGASAERICLHAAEVTLRHPATKREITFAAPADFGLDPRAALREALFNPEFTNAYRLIHGGADRAPGWYLDRFGDFLLSQSSDEALAEKERSAAGWWVKRYGLRGVYHKRLSQQPGTISAGGSLPVRVQGDSAPSPFVVRENGLHFELSFSEGASIGLFPDQRDNRRAVLINHVGPDFPLFLGAAEKAKVLNTFAHTCSFSVCAAMAGARTTSLDLSRKYLEWGKRNFQLNGLDLDGHEFIYGDAMDWMRRLARKGGAFDLLILDPPTFSRSKKHGTFRVEQDYGRLVQTALPLLNSGGVLLACTNAASLEPGVFLGRIAEATKRAGRRITRQQYAPQPPDFPTARGHLAYLKTVWMRIE